MMFNVLAKQPWGHKDGPGWAGGGWDAVESDEIELVAKRLSESIIAPQLYKMTRKHSNQTRR